MHKIYNNRIEFNIFDNAKAAILVKVNINNIMYYLH